MRSPSLLLLVVIGVLFIASAASLVWGKDYDPRFIRNYPPGYHGMWYYAQRFFDPVVEDKPPEERYTFDKFMGHVTGVTYPFFPVPFEWDYGTTRKFNLPDYNANNWR